MNEIRLILFVFVAFMTYNSDVYFVKLGDNTQGCIIFSYMLAFYTIYQPRDIRKHLIGFVSGMIHLVSILFISYIFIF